MTHLLVMTKVGKQSQPVLVHAQDLMTSMLARELAFELIELQEDKIR